jgi:hypothetical protein
MTDIYLTVTSSPSAPFLPGGKFSLGIARAGSSPPNIMLQEPLPGWLANRSSLGNIAVSGTPPQAGRTSRLCHLQITARNGASTMVQSLPPKIQRQIPVTATRTGRMPDYLPPTGHQARVTPAVMPVTITDLTPTIHGNAIQVKITAPPGGKITIQGMLPPGVKAEPSLGPRAALTLTVQTPR